MVLMLGGCSTLYFHDDDREKAFTEAKENFDKADPSKLFKEQREFFAKLKAEEEKAVLGQLRTGIDNALGGVWSSAPE